MVNETFISNDTMEYFQTSLSKNININLIAYIKQRFCKKDCLINR